MRLRMGTTSSVTLILLSCVFVACSGGSASAAPAYGFVWNEAVGELTRVDPASDADFDVVGLADAETAALVLETPDGVVVYQPETGHLALVDPDGLSVLLEADVASQGDVALQSSRDGLWLVDGKETRLISLEDLSTKLRLPEGSDSPSMAKLDGDRIAIPLRATGEILAANATGEVGRYKVAAPGEDIVIGASADQSVALLNRTQSEVALISSSDVAVTATVQITGDMGAAAFSDAAFYGDGPDQSTVWVTVPDRGYKAIDLSRPDSTATVSRTGASGTVIGTPDGWMVVDTVSKSLLLLDPSDGVVKTTPMTVNFTQGHLVATAVGATWVSNSGEITLFGLDEVKELAALSVWTPTAGTRPLQAPRTTTTTTQLASTTTTTQAPTTTTLQVSPTVTQPPAPETEAAPPPTPAASTPAPTPQPGSAPNAFQGNSGQRFETLDDYLVYLRGVLLSEDGATEALVDCWISAVFTPDVRALVASSFPADFPINWPQGLWNHMQAVSASDLCL